MPITALRVGSFNISFTEGFEQQGFAVLDVTGLSDYGEHIMGVPGSTDITITGLILPGVSPVELRAAIYSSLNPYKQFLIEATYTKAGSPNNYYQATARIISVKCNVNEVPASITVSLTRLSGWVGEPIIKIIEEGDNVIPGVFEFVAPFTLEIQLKSFFSLVDMETTYLRVSSGDTMSLTVAFDKILPIIVNSVVGLFDGSIIRIVTGLDYHACLITDGDIIDLPVIGPVTKGMLPISVNPIITLEIVGLPSTCSLEVALSTRKTYLTI